MSLACSPAGAAGEFEASQHSPERRYCFNNRVEQKNIHRNPPALDLNGSDEPQHGTDHVLMVSRVQALGDTLAFMSRSFCADLLSFVTS